LKLNVVFSSIGSVVKLSKQVHIWINKGIKRVY